MNETTNMKTILFSHHKSLDLHFYEEKNMNNFKRNDFLFLQKNYIKKYIIKKCISQLYEIEFKKKKKHIYVRKYENLSDYENLWIIIHIDVYLFVTPYKRKISLMKI